jgi:B-cell receptor-associated protein 31
MAVQSNKLDASDLHAFRNYLIESKQTFNMGITTNLVRTILFAEMTLFTLLIVPVARSFKKSAIKALRASKLWSSFLHILYVLYVMVFVMFADASFKMYTGEGNSLFLMYQAEMTFYLTGFTLFLALIFHMFVSMLVLLYKEEEGAQLLRKQSMNQKEYVQSLMDKSVERDDRMLSLEEEVTKLNKKLLASEILIKQLKSNQSEYSSLFDKYTSLKESLGNESRKSK